VHVSKEFKWSYRETGDTIVSQGFHLTVSHEELGLPDPSNPEEARQIKAALSREVELMILIEKVKAGRIPASSIPDKIAAWETPTTSNGSQKT
jgi:hypothetical protein